MSGTFAKGWQRYEHRNTTARGLLNYKPLPYPEWLGEALQGQRLLLAREQGAGDQIQFVGDSLDLVITVDTSIAQLAGALGKPVWVLLAAQSEWRWMRERDDSIWYPTARLFRQSKPGDWAEVVCRMNAALSGD